MNSITITAKSDGTVLITMRIGDKYACMRVTPAKAHELASELMMAATPEMALERDKEGRYRDA